MTAHASSQRILYLDPFSGLSGNMLLGALLDLGLDLERLRRELAKLDLKGYELKAETVLRGGIRGTHFEVLLDGHGHEHKKGSAHSHAHGHEHSHDHTHGHAHTHAHDHGHAHGHEHHHPHENGQRKGRKRAPAQSPALKVKSPQAHAHEHRHHADIQALIRKSGLSERVKAQSLKAFELLAEAEGRMHDKPADRVAFHEVGAVDSIIDFVGACIGLEALGIDQVWCGPVALGGEGDGGYVKCAHGLLPVPAFATLELMKGLPIRPCGVSAELTTPTGAALIRTLVTRFGPLPSMNIQALGYGAGTRNDPQITIPNILRVVLGETSDLKTARDDQQKSSARGHPPSAAADQADTVIELQANIDDATPEELGCLAEQLFGLGALDVFFAPIQMKKFRAATLLTVLIEPPLFQAVVEALFHGSSSFGIRYELKSRVKLARETRTVATPYGEVRAKLGTWKGEVVAIHPEYDDCRTLAEAEKVPLRKVIEAARRAAEAHARDGALRRAWKGK